MALKFQCSKCGADMLVKYLHPGETAKCRKCGAESAVPGDAREIPNEQADIEIKTSLFQEEKKDAAPDNCPTCRYFKDTGDDEGYCHRYPPKAEVFSRYPAVTALDWCGEHEKKA